MKLSASTRKLLKLRTKSAAVKVKALYDFVIINDLISTELWSHICDAESGLRHFEEALERLK